HGGQMLGCTHAAGLLYDLGDSFPSDRARALLSYVSGDDEVKSAHQPLPKSPSVGEGLDESDGRLTRTSQGRTMSHSRRARTQRGGLMLRRIERIGGTFLALVFFLTPGSAFAQGTIKIMYTDPLSGPFAQVGDQNLQQLKYIIDYINGRGGAL